MKPALLSALFLALSLVTVHAQTLTIPQIADGGAWQTTIVLTNTSASATPVNINFYQETSDGNTQAWSVPILETSSPQSLNLPAAGTMILHTSGVAANTTVGWAQIQASSDVNAYAIFTQRAPGRPDQDGTAPAVVSTNRVLIPFDNTGQYVTSIALANPSASAATITAAFQPSSGSPVQLDPISLPANGHMAFSLPAKYSSTAVKSGLLELTSSSGSLSALALRFNATGGFTTAPIYQASGNPILSGTSGSGNGVLPSFSSLSLAMTFSPQTYPASTIGLDIKPETGLSTFFADVNTAGLAHCTGSNGNHTFSCNTLAPGTVIFGYPATGQSLVVSSATLNVTLSDPVNNGVPGVLDLWQGTCTGTLTITGTQIGGGSITFSGPLSSGIYTLLK